LAAEIHEILGNFIMSRKNYKIFTALFNELKSYFFRLAKLALKELCWWKRWTLTNLCLLSEM